MICPRVSVDRSASKSMRRLKSSAISISFFIVVFCHRTSAFAKLFPLSKWDSPDALDSGFLPVPCSMRAAGRENSPEGRNDVPRPDNSSQSCKRQIARPALAIGGFSAFPKNAPEGQAGCLPHDRLIVRTNRTTNSNVRLQGGHIQLDTGTERHCLFRLCSLTRGIVLALIEPFIKG